MIALPSAVEAALAAGLAQSKVASSDRIRSRLVTVGDFRVVQGLSHMATDARIGLVLTVDGDNEYAEVLLAHSAPEFACDSDVVVAKEVASSPYDIVVQRDLRAIVWIWQLGAAVGCLDATTLRELNATPPDAGDRSAPYLGGEGRNQLWTGLPLAGPSDPRWALKESEGQALRGLVEDCTNALLDRGLVWHVDPGLFRPDLLDGAEAPEDLLDELLHWTMTRTLTLSDDDLTMLDEAGALRVNAWEEMSDLRADVWTSLQDVVLGASTGVTLGPSRGRRCLLTASHLRGEHDDRYEHVYVIGRRRAVHP